MRGTCAYDGFNPTLMVLDKRRGRLASQRVPRSTGQRRATSEATAGAMVDDNGGVPRFVGAASRVDGPHLVGGRGADRAVVGVGLAHAGRSQARMSC